MTSDSSDSDTEYSNGNIHENDNGYPDGNSPSQNQNQQFSSFPTSSSEKVCLFSLFSKYTLNT